MNSNRNQIPGPARNPMHVRVWFAVAAASIAFAIVDVMPSLFQEQADQAAMVAQAAQPTVVAGGADCPLGHDCPQGSHCAQKAARGPGMTSDPHAGHCTA
jgi:hypothetical protein